ncbi:hypothetical protein ACHMW6_19820 [Pseudoduganella sp. UC29_106]|uniref:hypothetical protein n=1 Tax=Pseudoduganella sp. UC29_106 TaxID=3374553 RepID=UPI003757DB31
MKKVFLLISMLLAFKYSFAGNIYEQKLYKQLKEVSASVHSDNNFPIFAKNVANLTQVLDQYKRSGGEDQNLLMASDEFLKALNSWAKAKLGERSQETYAQNMRVHQASLKIATGQILLYENRLKAIPIH